MAGAQASIDRSLALDQRFPATYLLLGDVRDAAGDKEGALAAFRQAGQLAPNDLVTLSAVGVFSAETGDLQGAADSFAQIIRSATKAQTSAQTRLDALEQFVAQSGGYDRLQSSAAAQRDALKNRIASYGSQLHLAYRNLALVLRDAGRPAEALSAAQQALTYAGDDTDKADIEGLHRRPEAEAEPMTTYVLILLASLVLVIGVTPLAQRVARAAWAWSTSPAPANSTRCRRRCWAARRSSSP